LIFNSNGKASQNLTQENRKAYSGLRSIIQFGNNLSVKDWLNLYDSIISPIMTYIVQANANVGAQMVFQKLNQVISRK
jgi:hypothetical protein